jgi:hypothetical protein
METVEVIASGPRFITPGERWQPVQGEELTRFLSHSMGNAPGEARQRIASEAADVLARSTEPGEAARRAGLIVGYVQSGKTTSFTAVGALARDNGYGLIIIVAGTSKNLLDQTRERLTEDLSLNDKDAYRRWVHIQSPKPGSDEATKMAAALADWADPAMAGLERATVLVTVMKQHVHMEDLAGVLNHLSHEMDLGAVTALIIDDEADQASLNIKKKPGDESATYSRLRRIRAELPSHTLLQYTATPQAPLLVSIADEISPDFTCVLTPGHGYTGGQYFFVEHHSDFVRHVPQSDLQLIDEDGPPPESLQRAFAVFAMGVAAGLKDLDNGPSQRSMLVHPSYQTLPQRRFIGWLNGMRDLWIGTLRLPADDPDRIDLVEWMLAPAFEELKATISELPELDDLLAVLPAALRKTSIIEVNAREVKPTPIEWPTGYAWVLVGGTLLDRGFTVEGLTVTYMPRGLGVGNADTVQQRGRFFGYKAGYAGYCRAWLDSAVDDAFTNYVEHEEAMRSELIEVARNGVSLKDWKRAFLLDRKLKPTRSAVIRLPLTRPNFAATWFSQRHFDGSDPELIAANRDLVAGFAQGISFQSDPDEQGALTEMQVHDIGQVSLERALRDLLAPYVMFDGDAARFTALRLLLELASEEAEEQCTVVRMSRGMRRRRAVDDELVVKNLLQGKNPGTGYVGDPAIRAGDDVTIQLHSVDLTHDDGTEDGDARQVIVPDATALAIWVPDRIAKSVIVQA